MSEESKKTEKIEQVAELSEQELDNVAGGIANDGGCISPLGPPIPTIPIGPQKPPPNSL
jgi:hypothetical protein